MTLLPSAVVPNYSPLRLESRSLAWRTAAVVLGTAVLALSSQVEVPMFPVPMTMQTLAVTLVGALYGWRFGALTIIAWLLEGAIGLPVFAGGAGGLPHFFGPTGGYLLSFPLVGALTGWLAERGWNGHRPVLAGLSMLAGNALCLALGGAWLAVAIGADKAMTFGVTPFIVGGVLKSVLGAAILMAANKRGAKA